MAVLNVAKNQIVRIPDLQMEEGSSFTGVIKSSDGQNLIIEHSEELEVKSNGVNHDEIYNMTWDVGDKKRSCPVVIRNLGKREIGCQIVIEERRESIRVHCEVEMFFTPIDPDDVAEIAKKVMGRVATAEDPESGVESLLNMDVQDDVLRSELSALRIMVEKISQQVEYLTGVVEGETGPGGGQEVRAEEVVDCSATGLAFLNPESIGIGTFLKARLIFNSMPKLRVECVGVVVRCEPHATRPNQPEKFNIGYRFTHIHESEREQIIRHVFRIERSMLRDRRAMA